MSRTGPVLLLLMLLAAGLVPTLGHSIPTSLDAETAPQGADIQISNETHWNGAVLVDGNVTVNSSGVLVIDPWANITVSGMHRIRVEGELRIKGIAAQPASIASSIIPESTMSSIGLWFGIVAAAGSTVIIDNVSIDHAEASVTIETTGATIANMSTRDAHVGVNVSGGEASVSDLTCRDIRISCISSDGEVSAWRVMAENVFDAVTSSGELMVSDLQVNSSSRALALGSGSNGTASGITLTNSTVLVNARGVVTVAVSDATLANVNLVVDGGDVDGLSLTGVMGTQTDRVVVAGDLQDLTLTDVDVSGDAMGLAAIEATVNGWLVLDNVSIDGPSIGAQLAGTGGVTLTDTVLSAEWTAVDSRGSGQLVVAGGRWVAGLEVGRLVAGAAAIDGLVVNGTADVTTGLTLFGGNHLLTDLTVERPYGSQDLTSVGLDITWTTATIGMLTTTNWHTGLRCGAGCELTGGDITAGPGNPTSGRSVRVDGGMIEVTNLMTSTHQQGLRVERGTVRASHFMPSGHGQHSAWVGQSGTVIVRQMDADAGIEVDATGPGSMLWGSAGSPMISVNSAQRFTELDVLVTDLQATPLDNISVESHGFTSWSNASGRVLVPVVDSGSLVSATDGFFGVTGTLTPASSNPTLQLPAIPQSGDWVLGGAGAVDALLLDGVYDLPENMTLRDGSRITLRNATLRFGAGAMLTLQNGSELVGDDGVVEQATILVLDSSSLSGMGEGLHTDAPVIHNCSAPTMWTRVHLDGGADLVGGCKLTLVAGSASTEDVNVISGSVLVIESQLTVLALDAGSPIAGLTVSVGDANSMQTDAQGEVHTSQDGLRIDGNGTTWQGLVVVDASRGGVRRFHAWDTNESSTQITFVFSTLASGTTAGWVRPEPVWSPWLLQDDLLVADGTTLTLSDGVELLSSPGVTITVAGVLQVGRATLGGADWGGVVVDGEHAIVEAERSTWQSARLAVDVVEGDASLDDVILTGGDAGLLRVRGGSTEVSHSLLENGGDACITQSAGSLMLDGVTLNACGDHALRVQQADLEATDITIGPGSERGMWLLEVSGEVDGVDATQHDGAGAALRLDSQGDELHLTDLTLASTGTVIESEQSPDIRLDGAQLTGEVGMALKNSSGVFTDVEIRAVTSAVAVVGRLGLRAIEFVNLTASTSGVGAALDIAGDETDASAPPVSVTGGMLNGSTAVATDGLPVSLVDVNVTGDLNAAGAGAAAVELRDGSFNGLATASGAASIWHNTTHVIRITGDDLPLAGMISFSQADVGMTGPSRSADVEGVEVVLVRSHTTASGTISTSMVTITATAAGHIMLTVDRQLSSSELVVPLVSNTAPIVTITAPTAGGDVEALEPFVLSATIIDPDRQSGEAPATLRWWLDAPGAELEALSLANGDALTLSVEGLHVLTAEATDAHGDTGSASITFTVQPHDADDDTIASCDQNSWFDATESRHCGPDTVDADDDNDRVIDSRDDFPTDACASKDTDLDGMPDSIVAGCATTLVADDDDDNDGTPDINDGAPLNARIQGVASESSPMNLLIWVLTIIAGIGVLVLVLRAREDSGGPGEGL